MSRAGTALVTGATGLVGFHIVERLLADGWTVRALARFPDRARDALPHAVDVRQGDVVDQSSFEQAARGCHVVFHAAASIITHGGWEAFHAVNVAGTRNAIAAAAQARARLLHVSSVAVYGSRSRYDAARSGRKTDESVSLPDLPESAHYARSKRDSEDLVMRAHVEGRVWATAVRPCVVYGVRDRQFVPRMAVLVDRLAIPLLRGGRSTLGVVHAANVASGAVLAATTDSAGGKAFNLTNDFDVTVRRFFELAGQGLGRRPLYVPLPMWAARGAFSAGRWITRIALGDRFRMVGNAAIDFLAEDNPFSSDRAKRELGWRPAVHPEQGVPEAFRWWLETERARR